MHIAEGILSPEVLGAGAVLTALGAGIGLRRLKGQDLVTAAMLTSVFFVGSLVHVPLGPGNVHLILNGLLGILLGSAVFPVVLAALLLQAVLFQFGGLTVLGVNTFTMAFPAMICGIALRPWLLRGGKTAAAASFACGFLSVAGSALLTALALVLTEEGFLRAAELLFAAHLPVMLVEGLITAAAVNLLVRIRPEILRALRK